MKEQVDIWLKNGVDEFELSSCLETVNSDDRSSQYFAIIGIRKNLCNGNCTFLTLQSANNSLLESNPPIQAVIDAGIVPRMIELAYDSKEPHLQVH